MSTAVEEPYAIGPLLRTWRERRRFSQQQLSDLSAVSTRHLSRVETGRAHPTAEMILHLSDHLDVPLRDRNRMLLAAGFAPRYRDHDLDDSSIAVVMDGLRGLLDAHLPYPALLLDDHWDVVDANTAVDRLLSGCAPHLLQPPINVVRLSVHPEGLAPRIRNLDSWIGYLHRQVLNRAERTHEPRQFALADEIAGHLGGPPTQDPDTGPVLTLELEVSGRTARFFSISAQLTTANDSALEGLHLETFLPVDKATRQLITS